MHLCNTTFFPRRPQWPSLAAWPTPALTPHPQGHLCWCPQGCCSERPMCAFTVVHIPFPGRVLSAGHRPCSLGRQCPALGQAPGGRFPSGRRGEPDSSNPPILASFTLTCSGNSGNLPWCGSVSSPGNVVFCLSLQNAGGVQ